MNYKQKSSWYSSEVIIQLKPLYIIEKSEILKPKINIKLLANFKDFPPNENIKLTPNLIIKAIEWGMILQIDYKGESDSYYSGHNRVIVPYMYGKSKDGKDVILGYHLKGWSVSEGKYVSKEWRMFRLDRIMNTKFIGAFFRYKNDIDLTSIKLSKIIKEYDFNLVRKNQHNLMLSKAGDLSDRIIVHRVNTLQLEPLDVELDLNDPFEYLPKKDAKITKVTFAKNIYKKEYIAILGASIVKGKQFKYDNIKYKSLGWFNGNMLPKHINSVNKFQLYILKEFT